MHKEIVIVLDLYNQCKKNEKKKILINVII